LSIGEVVLKGVVLEQPPATCILRRFGISRIPLYRQVQEYILEGIRSNRWKDGELLPSENQIAETLQVSRITIRHALDELVQKGLVYRIQGKGTFLSSASQGEPVIFDSGNRDTCRSLPLIAYLSPRLHNDYMAALLNNIEEEISTRRHFLLFSRTHEDQGIEKAKLKDLAHLGVKGIVIFPVDGEVFNEEILRLTLDSYPLVIIDRYLRGLETNCVCSDNLGGAFQAAGHLLALGHRNIAFISTNIQGTSSIEDRLAGYERAFAEYGVPIRPEFFLTDLKVGDEQNKERIRDFLKANPGITGILSVNTTIGIQIIEAAAETGRSIPQDLSIVFFDKIEHLPFKPTYIKQQAADIAKEAIRLLFDIIEDPNKRRTKVDLPTILVEGCSTAPATSRLNHRPSSHCGK
jgi:DNA-binding LacI/PurR family transcriptional regulator/DNA-binding transcriptional regulator YhcF (GntR family)